MLNRAFCSHYEAHDDPAECMAAWERLVAALRSQLQERDQRLAAIYTGESLTPGAQPATIQGVDASH